MQCSASSMIFSLNAGGVAHKRTMASEGLRICGPSFQTAVRFPSRVMGVSGASARRAVVYAAKGGFGEKKVKKQKADKAKGSQVGVGRVSTWSSRVTHWILTHSIVICIRAQSLLAKDALQLSYVSNNMYTCLCKLNFPNSESYGCHDHSRACASAHVSGKPDLVQQKGSAFIEAEGKTPQSDAIDQFKDVLVRKEEDKVQASSDDEFAAKLAALKAKQPAGSSQTAAGKGPTPYGRTTLDGTMASSPPPAVSAKLSPVVLRCN
eukprot:1712903-Pyramimonas_sp.AAC.1